MPKEKSFLSDADIKKIADWFNHYIGDRNCAICDGHNWQPVNFLTTGVVYDINRDCHRADLVVPMARIHCLNCGQVLLFDAAKIGLEF